MRKNFVGRSATGIPRLLGLVLLAGWFALSAFGCSAGTIGGPRDGAVDSGGMDSGGSDSGADSGADPGADAASDTAADPGTDAGSDSGVDAGSDAGADSGGDQANTGPEMWFYAAFNLQVNANVTTLKALMDRAAAAGYHGVVLADFKFNLLQTGLLASWYATNLADVLSYAASKGLEVLPEIFPFGYSEGILYQNPDLAEGLPVFGAGFTVQPDMTLALVPSYQGPVNGGFETHSGDTFTGWSWQDGAGTRTIADTAVFHSGGVSARIDPGSGNARIVQALTLIPHRQYHGSFWFKTSGLTAGYVQVVILDATSGKARNFNEVRYASTQDWTRYDFTFNTMDSAGVNLYLGVWGGFSSGQAWFDDVTIEETALVNLIRRPGAPLAAKDGNGGALIEGTDIATVADPAIANGFDDWHTPPVVTVPAGSTLKSGDTVSMDFYAVSPVAGSQVGSCLTEPAVDQWMHDNMVAVAQAFPDVQGFFLGYDEMRHMNSCSSCATRGLSAGDLLAWHVGQAIAVVRAEHPGARIHVWSDMFDPNHNARADYYMVVGDIAGSWQGLPPDVVIMNWHLGDAASLQFFAGRGHQQIISGYYDSGDGAASVAKELAAAQGVSGIRGMMYTTWQNDFSQLEAYASAARAAW